MMPWSIRPCSKRSRSTFDCKRLKDRLTKILETVVAFANSDGGVIALGLEDPDKAQGRIGSTASKRTR